MESLFNDPIRILTFVISIWALLISYLNRKRTIRLDHQAALVDLEVKRQELLLLATKINLAQIQRNLELKRINSIMRKLPPDIITKFEKVLGNMGDLTIKTEVLGPMESVQFSGSHTERVQILKNIGVLLKTKELSDRYDLIIGEQGSMLKELGFD
jgi:hypothetical protein